MPDNDEIITGAKTWFKEVIAENHVKNVEKCANPNEFNINPFTVGYLANFLDGKVTKASIAKALIYPRILGTSIATSFGQNIQKFISTVLSAYGSTTSGIDIEFVDAVDKRKKYCQLKAGPNTINKDDVETIHNHFRGIKNLARTNNLSIQQSDFVVGILYGNDTDVSGHYKELRDSHCYNLYVGKEFWYRLTGDNDFYNKLIKAISSVASDYDGRELIEQTIIELSNTDEIKKLAE